MHDKLKVLCVASDPFRQGASPRLDQEVRAIRKAIRRSRARDRVELVPHFATRASDLREAVLRHQPRIVHFAAHGDSPGAIYLADEQGQPGRVDRDALRTLFSTLNHTVRVVVLNGCSAPETVDALSEVVDYTVGMSRSISDESAIEFAGAFYSALATGRNVLAAFELAVSQLELQANPEASIPLRRIRRGVNLDIPLVSPPAEGAAGPPPPDGARDGGPRNSRAEAPGADNRPRPSGGEPGSAGPPPGHKGRGFTLRIIG
jgi:hypothetical protein